MLQFAKFLKIVTKWRKIQIFISFEQIKFFQLLFFSYLDSSWWIAVATIHREL